MIDPFANSINSPIGIIRLPARREREMLARRVLGQIPFEDGELRPGNDEEQLEVRQWLYA